jgi:hypothetical protein
MDWKCVHCVILQAENNASHTRPSCTNQASFAYSYNFYVWRYLNKNNFYVLVQAILLLLMVTTFFWLVVLLIFSFVFRKLAAWQDRRTHVYVNQEKICLDFSFVLDPPVEAPVTSFVSLDGMCPAPKEPVLPFTLSLVALLVVSKCNQPCYI